MIYFHFFREKTPPLKKQKKYGYSMRKVAYQSIGIAVVILLTSYFMRDSTNTFVSVVENVERRAMEVQCSDDYKEELSKFKGNSMQWQCL